MKPKAPRKKQQKKKQSATPGRGRGRPARLSRAAILAAGLGLLERSPEEPLTLSRVANEVDAVPAALYRHIGSHDELLDSVLGLVFEDLRVVIRRRASWSTQVRDWMASVRGQLLRYPAVVHLIGRRGRTSPAWLDVTCVLIEILEGAGLRGAKLARAHLWIAETTMGHILTEAALSFPEQVAAAREALPELPEASRNRYAPLLRHLDTIDEEAYFRLISDRTIAAIAALVGDGSAHRIRG